VAAAVPAAPIDTFRDVPSTTMVRQRALPGRPAPRRPAASRDGGDRQRDRRRGAASTRSPNEIVASAFANDVPRRRIPVLFQSDENGPVRSDVRELWARGGRGSRDCDRHCAGSRHGRVDQRGSSLNAPLDLFQFLRPSSRRTS